MSRKSLLILGGCCLFFVFIFISYLVHRNVFTASDFDATVKLQDHMPRRFDILFSYLSMIGRFEFMLVALLIIIFIRRKIKTVAIVILFGIIHVFELYGKTFVSHKPPPHFMLRTTIPVNLPQFYVSTENSYPSGHAARAFFITTIIFLLIYASKKFSKEQKFITFSLLICYDLVMCISRVYLGEHWLSDIIGGSILGLSLALIGEIFL